VINIISNNDYIDEATDFWQVKTASMKSLNVTAGFEHSEALRHIIHKDMEEDDQRMKRNEETETQLLDNDVPTQPPMSS